MKITRNIARGALVALSLIVIGGGVAFADTTHDTTDQPDHNSDDFSFTLTGEGACQDDGSYLIAWTINNTQTSWQEDTNPEMNIVSSSNETVVPLGTVPAGQSKTYTQKVDGTVASTTSLEVKGAWNTDLEDQVDQTATVANQNACTQPQAPATDTTTTVTGSTPVTPIVVTEVPGFTGKN